jgi:uncharacterized RDD family membrane protein YckC
MRCNSCGATNPPEAVRCQRCQIRFAPAMRYQQSSAAPQLDFAGLDQDSSTQIGPAPHSFGVLSNPTSNRVTTPMQPDLFAYAPQGKVVRMRMSIATPASQAEQPARQAPHPSTNAASAEDPLSARGKSAPRRSRTSTSQSEFDFAPQTHRPFSNELKPVHGLSAAPLRVRFYSLLIDALIVAVLSIMFAAAVFVAFSASGEKLTLRDLFALPWYLPAAIPVLLSIGYKALWAVFEHPTIGLQSFGLDVISMDGHRPTVSQRMVRVFAGWLTVGGMVGALWAVVSQERYSMQDMISQTFLTLRGE